MSQARKVTSLAVNAAPGGTSYILSWVNPTDLTLQNVRSITVVYIQETADNVSNDWQYINLPTATNGALTTSYTFTGLAAGTSWSASVEVAANGIEFDKPNPEYARFSVVSVPSQPKYNIIVGDQRARVQLLNAANQQISFDDRLSNFDGFNKLTNLSVLIRDITDNVTYTIVVDNDASDNLYRDGGFLIGPNSNNGQIAFSQFQNDHKYSIALMYRNDVGNSPISQTKTMTPSLLPSPIEVSAVEDIALGGNGSGNVVLWTRSQEVELLSFAGLTNFTLHRADFSGNNLLAPTQLQVFNLDGSGNNVSLVTRDASNNIVFTQFNGLGYKYTFLDNTAVVGKKYRYYITAGNAFGESTVKDSDATNPNNANQRLNADVITAGGLPSLTQTSTPGNQQIKVKVTSANGNGLSLSNEVLVKVSLDSDLSMNAVLDYDWKRMALDASNELLVTGLTNGIKYRVEVKNESVSGSVLTNQVYVSGTASTESKTPFTNPAVPTGLMISDVSGNTPLNGKLRLSWNNQSYLGVGVDASVNFILSRREQTGIDGSSNPIMSSATTIQVGTSNSYEDSGLTNGTRYQYTLIARVLNTELSSNIDSAASSPVSGTPFASPSNVTGLTASCSGNGNIDVSFNAAIDASAVYLALLQGQNVIATIDPVQTNFTILRSTYGLVLGETYSIEIKTYVTKNGNRYYSSGVSTNAIPFLTPGQVQDLQLSIQSNQIFAVWEKPLNVNQNNLLNGVTLTGYDVKLLNATGSATLKTFSVSGAEYLLITGSDVSNNNLYRVQVLAKGTSGNNASGVAVLGAPNTSDSVLIGSGPDAPVLLNYEASDRAIKLKWVHTDVNNITASNFKIFQDFVYLNNVPLPVIVDKGLYADGQLSGRQFETTISNLVNGTGYRFEVMTTRLNRDSVSGSAVVTNATPFKNPSDPLNGSFTVASKTANLSWSAPLDNGGAGSGSAGSLEYTVEFYNFNTNAIVNGSNITSNTNYTDANLVNGTRYYAIVKARYQITSNGQTSYPTSTNGLRIPASGSIFVNPAPENVSNLVATPGDRNIKLTWTDPSSVNYPYSTTIVQRKVGSGAFSQIALVNYLGQYTDSNLTNGETYTYRVIAQHNNPNAQQVTGVDTSATKPFGKPLLSNVNISTGNKLDYNILYCESGSGITGLQLVAIDVSGNALVNTNVSTSGAVSVGGSSTSFNGQPCVSGDIKSLNLPRLNGGVRLDSLLVILSNAAGAAVASHPLPPNAFDK